MGRLVKILGGLVVVAVALAVAGVAILKSIDIDAYKATIAEQVRAATGRELAIDGDMALDISLRPALVLREVSFANPAGMSRPRMATLQRLEAQVDLLPLLSGEVHINHIVLDGLDVLLERNGEGVENWVLRGGPAVAGSGGGHGPLPLVEEVRLRNVLLTYADRQTGEQTALRLDAVDFTSRDANGPLSFTAKGGVQALPFEAAGDVGSMAALLSGGSMPVKATLAIGGLTVAIAGTVAEPRMAKGLALTVTAKTEELATTAAALQNLVPGFQGVRLPSKMGPLDLSAKIAGSADALAASDIRLFAGSADSFLLSVTGAVLDLVHLRQSDVNIVMEGKDLSAFSALAGTTLPADKPFRLSGRLSDGDNALGLDGLSFKAGRSTLGGWITATRQPSRPRIEAQIVADLIDMNDLPLPPTDAKALPSANRVFSAEPFALDSLTTVDADVSFRAKRMLAQGLILSDVESQFVLNGGILTAKPIKASLAGGQAQGAMTVAAADPGVAGLNIDLTLTGVQGGLLARDLAATDLLDGGPLNVRIDLQGRGKSQQALAAALTGEVRGTMGPGRIRNSALDTFGADVGMSAIRAINPFAKEEAYTQITCGAARFVFAGGKAVADRGIALESEKMVVIGSGHVDLASEQIDFAIRPEAREGLGINLGGAASMVRLTGTLKQPSVGIDTVESAKKALSLGAAFATGGISLLAEGLLGRITQDDSPCKTALGGQSPPSQTSPRASAPQAPAAAQPKEEGGLGGLLKGFGRSLDDALGKKP